MVSDAPFRVKDLCPYVHSFNVRVLGVVAYALNGEMRFFFMGDEKCLDRGQADALKREFIGLLRHHAAPARDGALAPAAARCGRRMSGRN